MQTLLKILLSFLLISPGPVNKPQIDVHRFLNTVDFAHRGLYDNKDIPENSIPAFENAVKHHYGIELDVQLTKDGVPVVVHDENLFRLCAVNKKVSTLNYKDLEKLGLNLTSVHIPSLEDTLKTVHGRSPIMIELKTSTKNAKKISDAVWKVVRSYSGPYAIISFNTTALSYFKSAHPHVLTGQLVSKMDTKLFKKSPLLYEDEVKDLKKQMKPSFLSVKNALVSKNSKAWQEYRQIMDVPVAVWTIRSEKDAGKALKNADAIVFEKFRPQDV